MSRGTSGLFRQIVAAVLFVLALVGTAGAGNVEVESLQTTVSDLQRARAFYTEVLQFIPANRTSGPEGAAVELRLGEETLILFQPTTVGRVVPDSMSANDRLFKHIAIVVSDMDAAYRQLVAHGVSLVSPGPQTLPEWNFDAAGIRAIYFRDPDGHFLELIQFPSKFGEPKWQRLGKQGQLFLGIDHTAIVVRDMPASRHFYRDLIGLTIVGESLNYGGEQELLSGVRGARVKITGFRGVKGPGVELLHYENPGTAEAFADDPTTQDLLHWQINLRGSGREGVFRDPDGHMIYSTPRPESAFEFDGMRDIFRRHWTRYLMEGAELGIFMIVALYLTIAFEHPRSPLGLVMLAAWAMEPPLMIPAIAAPARMALVL